MAKGSLPDAHAALIAALEASRDALAPELHVYDLWRPDMALPAVWTWMAPGSVPSQRKDNCTATHVDRIVVVVGVDPAALVTDDARRLIDYVQLLREALDPVLYAPRPLGGQTRAVWGSGQQFVTDQLGDAHVLCAELPVEITLDRHVNPAP